jgi:hypothetical protein
MSELICAPTVMAVRVEVIELMVKVGDRIEEARSEPADAGVEPVWKFPRRKPAW